MVEQMTNLAANQKANTRARLAAARWVRENFPDVWRELLAEERTALGLAPTTPQSQRLVAK